MNEKAILSGDTANRILATVSQELKGPIIVSTLSAQSVSGLLADHEKEFSL